VELKFDVPNVTVAYFSVAFDTLPYSFKVVLLKEQEADRDTATFRQASSLAI
jgi:hypothetical protein